MLEQGEIAVTISEILVEIGDRADAPALVSGAEPFVGVLKFPGTHRAEPHRHGQAERLEFGHHVHRHIPGIQTRGGHVERRQHAARVVRRIHVRGDPPLAIIRRAIGHFGPELCPAERGQNQSCENGDDRDDHEKLDQRKAGDQLQDLGGSGKGRPPTWCNQRHLVLISTKSAWPHRKSCAQTSIGRLVFSERAPQKKFSPPLIHINKFVRTEQHLTILVPRVGYR